jgi:hypothetical protein
LFLFTIWVKDVNFVIICFKYRYDIKADVAHAVAITMIVRAFQQYGIRKLVPDLKVNSNRRDNIREARRKRVQACKQFGFSHIEFI